MSRDDAVLKLLALNDLEHVWRHRIALRICITGASNIAVALETIFHIYIHA